jgi:hypothetical protein|nr:MAG TPA: hypothetical protein [Caudoviricetes sp.]
MFTHSRYPKTGKNNYEVSSKGDKRFSALYATLRDGRTIEQALDRLGVDFDTVYPDYIIQ